MPDNAADVILANHMIYHIPDQQKALSEFRRVLKPGGKMIAATNSAGTMQELKTLRTAAARRIIPDFPELDESVALSFVMETGDQILKQAFERVELNILDSWLVFREPQPVIDYIGSSRDWWEEILGEAIS